MHAFVIQIPLGLRMHFWAHARKVHVHPECDGRSHRRADYRFWCTWFCTCQLDLFCFKKGVTTTHYYFYVLLLLQLKNKEVWRALLFVFFRSSLDSDVICEFETRPGLAFRPACKVDMLMEPQLQHLGRYGMIWTSMLKLILFFGLICYASLSCILSSINDSSIPHSWWMLCDSVLVVGWIPCWSWIPAWCADLWFLPGWIHSPSCFRALPRQNVSMKCVTSVSGMGTVAAKSARRATMALLAVNSNQKSPKQRRDKKWSFAIGVLCWGPYLVVFTFFFWGVHCQQMNVFSQVVSKEKAAFVIPVLRAACGEHAAPVVIVCVASAWPPCHSSLFGSKDWTMQNADRRKRILTTLLCVCERMSALAYRFIIPTRANKFALNYSCPDWWATCTDMCAFRLSVQVLFGLS